VGLPASWTTALSSITTSTRAPSGSCAALSNMIPPLTTVPCNVMFPSCVVRRRISSIYQHSASRISGQKSMVELTNASQARASTFSIFAIRLRKGRNTKSASKAAIPSAATMMAKTGVQLPDCERNTSQSATNTDAAPLAL
jgi:hypothetical protein